MLFVGFSNGRIRALDVDSIEVLKEAPLPHYLKIDLNDASDVGFFERTVANGARLVRFREYIFVVVVRSTALFLQ